MKAYVLLSVISLGLSAVAYAGGISAGGLSKVGPKATVTMTCDSLKEDGGAFLGEEVQGVDFNNGQVSAGIKLITPENQVNWTDLALVSNVAVQAGAILIYQSADGQIVVIANVDSNQQINSAFIEVGPASARCWQ